MSLNGGECIQMTHHSLRISNPKTSLSFYQEKLGMTLIAQRIQGGATHYFLGFVEPGEKIIPKNEETFPRQPICFLELIYNPGCLDTDIQKQPNLTEGYWKIAFSVRDLGIARKRLVANQVAMSSAFQIPDVAYLCHCNDPDGYCVEFIQHNFTKNHRPEPENPAYKLGVSPTFSLVTYRINDPARSLEFYSKLLGLRLLSKQTLHSKKFTLYFLACTTDVPPHPNLEAVENREWLWQRPYAILELQHIWGTEDDIDFAYRTDPVSGFEGVSFATNDLKGLLTTLRQNFVGVVECDSDPMLGVESAALVDPDGYPVRLLSKG